jgi:hypothetical protein
MEALRRLAIEQPEPLVTRVIAVLISAVFLGAVLDLVRRGRLNESYTPVWVVAALTVMGAALWFDGVRMVTRLVGAWTPSSTLFLFGQLFLLVVALSYAVRLSGLGGQVKTLAQELSLLREEVARLRGDATAE